MINDHNGPDHSGNDSILELGLTSVQSANQLSTNIPLFSGEKINPELNGREVTYISHYTGEVPGCLYLTNYKLYFRSNDLMKPQIIHVPLCTISKIEKFGGSKTKGENTYGIFITCKDIRTLRFAHNPENHSRRDVFEKLRQYAFPLTHSPNNKLFCFEAKVIVLSFYNTIC